MTETLVGVNPPSLKDPADPPSPEELAAAKEVVRQARAQGLALTGPGGLLKALTKTVIETALEEELAEHLGYDKHDPVGRNRGNSRNGKRAKTVLTDSSAAAALDDLHAKWGARYPAIIRLWRNAWQEFIPFLDYDVEIRKVLCSTNAIESLNARYRRAVKARGHFPSEQAAMKCLYLVTRSLDPKGTGQTRSATRWKPALNAFAITFADRMPTKAN